MTETRAPYTFALAEPPQYTLPELYQLKREYIEHGLAQFDALALITTVFGSPIDIRHREYTVWQRGRITAVYHIEQGHYLPAQERYEETQTLAVWLDCSVSDVERGQAKTQVCRLKVGDDVRPPEQLFIPGKWLADMLSEYESAREIAITMQEADRERERQRLIKELMIGADI